MTTPTGDDDITVLLKKLITPIVLANIQITKTELASDIAKLNAHTQEHFKLINSQLRDLVDVVERSLRLEQVHSEKLCEFIKDQEALMKQNVAIERELKKILLSMNLSPRLSSEVETVTDTATVSDTRSLGSTGKGAPYTHSFTPIERKYS
jgi:hypothetical protein